MTIREIYERYEVPNLVAEKRLSSAAAVARLQSLWVGPPLDWFVLTKAALFYDFDDQGLTKLIRKKVGVDKFTVSVMERAKFSRIDDILIERDWYCILFLYICSQDTIRDSKEYQKLKSVIENNAMGNIESIWSGSDREFQRFLSINIQHYKNPSL